MVILNQKSKHNYFDNLDINQRVKPFQKTFNPYFSKMHSRGDTILILIEKKKKKKKKNELILNNVKVATIFRG